MSSLERRYFVFTTDNTFPVLNICIVVHGLSRKLQCPEALERDSPLVSVGKPRMSVHIYA